MRRIIVGTCAALVALGIGLAGPAVAAPVPVTALSCDGDTYKCTANLRFGDNNWKAGWGCRSTTRHPAPPTAPRCR